MLLNFIVLAPLLSVVHAGLFTRDSQVKMLDAKSFKKVMKKDETSLVAFVAPWCGHCQRMAPELSKAAKGLSPLVPTYAVDCDDEGNKRLCAEQGVEGFPTVKVFPRGSSQPPIPYQGERTAGGFFHFTSRRIPNKNKKLMKEEEVKKWVSKKQATPKALLLSKDTKTPLLWQVLANKFEDKFGFAFYNDKNSQVASSLFNVPATEKGKSKLILFGGKKREGVVYDGVMKLEALTKYFEDILKGNVDLTPPPVEKPEEEQGTKAEESGSTATAEETTATTEESTAATEESTVATEESMTTTEQSTADPEPSTTEAAEAEPTPSTQDEAAESSPEASSTSEPEATTEKEEQGREEQEPPKDEL